MKSNYKVGDEVTIKSWEEIKETLDDSNNYKGDTISFVADMHKDLGKTYKIDQIENGLKYTRYQLNYWWYVEDWIKPKETKSRFSNKHLIFYMCLQLLSGNKPNYRMFKDRIPFKDEGGFDWHEFADKLSMNFATQPCPNWSILTLDIDFAQLLLTRLYECPFFSLIDIDEFKKPIALLIDDINWVQTPEGFQFWDKKCQYYKSKSDSEILTNQEQSYKTENHEIKLQRKKSTVIRGTVPEGSITRGRKRKVAITVGHLSNAVCIGG